MAYFFYYRVNWEKDELYENQSYDLIKKLIFTFEIKQDLIHSKIYTLFFDGKLVWKYETRMTYLCKLVKRL